MALESTLMDRTASSARKATRTAHMVRRHGVTIHGRHRGPLQTSERRQAPHLHHGCKAGDYAEDQPLVRLLLEPGPGRRPTSMTPGTARML